MLIPKYIEYLQTSTMRCWFQFQLNTPKCALSTCEGAPDPWGEITNKHCDVSPITNSVNFGHSLGSKKLNMESPWKKIQITQKFYLLLHDFHINKKNPYELDTKVQKRLKSTRKNRWNSLGLPNPGIFTNGVCQVCPPIMFPSWSDPRVVDHHIRLKPLESRRRISCNK